IHTPLAHTQSNAPLKVVVVGVVVLVVLVVLVLVVLWYCTSAYGYGAVEVEWNESYGMNDLERKPPLAATITRFCTAAACLPVRYYTVPDALVSFFFPVGDKKKYLVPHHLILIYPSNLIDGILS